MFYVYILKCNDGTYYTGQTNNIERRIKEHNQKTKGYCQWKRPVVLVWSTQVNTRAKARVLEIHIKKRGAGRYLRNLELQKQFGHLCKVIA